MELNLNNEIASIDDIIFVPNTGSMTYSSMRCFIFSSIAYVFASIYYNYAAANTNYNFNSMYLNLSDYFSSISAQNINGRPVVMNAQSTAQVANVSIFNTISVDPSKIFVVGNSSATGTYVTYSSFIIYGTRK